MKNYGGGWESMADGGVVESLDWSPSAERLCIAYEECLRISAR
jgi:hypothetical protein